MPREFHTDPEELKIRGLLRQWWNGGSPLPLLELLMKESRHDEVAAYARLALSAHDCECRDELEELLAEVAVTPPAWTDAVVEFAESPSVEGWDRLMQFTPHDASYHRVRNTVAMLRRLGTDANLLFKFSTRNGIVPDAFELAESGNVDVETVLDRVDEAPAVAKPIWYGVAAEAAFAHGDRFNAVRLLRQAYNVSDGTFGPEFSVMSIRDKADPELHAMLDNVGIPRFDRQE